MALTADMLQRILGAPDSPTGKLVALRHTPGPDELETGVWYSNFTRVRTEAERRGIPFFAMWTNGDLCGFCKRFTKNILEPSFLEKMKTSGGLWWLGGSMDESEEDRRGGTGFTWCRGPNGDVNYFPFFAVTQTVDGTIQHGFFGSGHDWDQRKTAPDGTKEIMHKLYSVLSEPYVAPEKKETDATPVPATGQKPLQPKTPSATPVQTNTVLHIRFNPSWDAAKIARFQDALKASGGHCPCRSERTPDTMCMCKDFLEKNTPGACHCGAYERYVV